MGFAKHVIMCRPDYFDVTYELSTNRWMNKNVRPDKALAVRQWRALLDGYERYGVSVDVMSGQPGLNDMVFMANAGLPVGDHFIVSKFFHKERRGEVPFIEKYFLSNNKKMWTLVEVDECFEGQGDAFLLDGKNLFIGYGIRTSKNVIPVISSIVKSINPFINIVPLAMRPAEDYSIGEKIFYHLDTCFLYLKKIETFLVYPRALDVSTLRILGDYGNLVLVNQKDACSFVCNSVEVGDILFTPQFNNPVLHRFFEKSGYEIIQYDMSEFMKSGGAVKCLSLEIG